MCLFAPGGRHIKTVYLHLYPNGRCQWNTLGSSRIGFFAIALTRQIAIFFNEVDVVIRYTSNKKASLINVTAKKRRNTAFVTEMMLGV